LVSRLLLLLSFTILVLYLHSLLWKPNHPVSQGLDSPPRVEKFKISETSIPPPKPQKTSTEFPAAQFLNLTERALGRFPRKDIVRSRRDHSFHHPPAELTQGSQEMGAILDSLKVHPRLIPLGLSFFLRCAKDTEVLEAVRITCVRYYLDWSRRGKVQASLYELPSRLVTLANTLPESR